MGAWETGTQALRLIDSYTQIVTLGVSLGLKAQLALHRNTMTQGLSFSFLQFQNLSFSFRPEMD